jgi:hypothetical protein
LGVKRALRYRNRLRRGKVRKSGSPKVGKMCEGGFGWSSGTELLEGNAKRFAKKIEVYLPPSGGHGFVSESPEVGKSESRVGWGVGVTPLCVSPRGEKCESACGCGDSLSGTWRLSASAVKLPTINYALNKFLLRH